MCKIQYLIDIGEMCSVRYNQQSVSTHSYERVYTVGSSQKTLHLVIKLYPKVGARRGAGQRHYKLKEQTLTADERRGIKFWYFVKLAGDKIGLYLPAPRPDREKLTLPSVALYALGKFTSTTTPPSPPPAITPLTN